MHTLSDKKRIYIAYTGGTIGMQASEKGFVPVAGFLTDTLAHLPEFHRPEMPQFTLHEYDTLIDSSDMVPADWQLIANDIQANYHDYDGFIILHGTDTMAYTASALSFMFENLAKPVIITGSQIPLAQLRSDGQANLLNALYIAANYAIREVTLFFNNSLFRGNRARKVNADGFHAFDSPNHPSLLDAGIHIQSHVSIAPSPTSFDDLKVANIQSQAVGMLTLYPGMSTELLENVLRQPVKALILLTYGVGNAPSNPALLDQLKQAREKEILVVNCTQCMRGRVDMSGYANGKLVQQTQVVSGKDMTPEAALAKLHYVLSQDHLSFKQQQQMMSDNLRGEMTP
ncbi:asparaginase [Glaciecola siphonariae]|uniref:asparaginase n=1 Tax=Glaciecola siphonariae TaxID=521012 RepID=A0ABV9LVJ9_9ALTE